MVPVSNCACPPSIWLKNDRRSLMAASAHIHGTAVAIDGRGLLLIGPSGAGKSDLALRLMEDGAALVGDDALVCSPANHGRITLCSLASPPISQHMAIGGIGLVRPHHLATRDQPTLLSLVVRLVPALPDPLRADLGRWGPVGDYYAPEIALVPFEHSAPIKVRLALERWGL